MDGATKKLLVAGLVGGFIGVVLTQVTEKVIIPLWHKKCEKDKETKDPESDDSPKANL